jgi:hypothetical protein
MNSLHKLSLVSLVLASLTFTGCGQGNSLSGTYEGQMMSVEFKSDGKAYVTNGGGTVEAKYRRDGDKIILENPPFNLVLTLNKDGTLSGGPMEDSLKKKQ